MHGRRLSRSKPSRLQDGPADNRDEFTNGGCVNEPVLILMDVYVSPVVSCLSIIASFNPICKGFLK